MLLTNDQYIYIYIYVQHCVKINSNIEMYTIYNGGILNSKDSNKICSWLTFCVVVSNNQVDQGSDRKIYNIKIYRNMYAMFWPSAELHVYFINM